MGDYYLSIRRTGVFHSEWEWRILRRSRLVGPRLGGRGFATTESAARSQGRIALKKFLADQATPMAGSLTVFASPQEHT
jgi:hypothetical protein